VSGIPDRPDLPPPPSGQSGPPPPSAVPTGMPPISTAPPAPPPGTRATWKVWEIFVVFILSVLAGGLIYVLFGSFASGCASDLAVPLIASEAGYVVAVGLWVKFVDKAPLSALGAPTRPLGDFGVGVAGGAIIYVGAALFGALVVTIAESIIGHPPLEPQQVPACVQGSAALWTAPAVILAAPIGEETFFRGYLYNGLRRKLPVWSAVLLSSIWFALLHFQTPAQAGLILVLAILPVGIGLALVYEWRQSLLASMAAHMTFNLIGYALIVWGR
jgi:membrane protease YdiL (CAAX protease family)